MALARGNDRLIIMIRQGISDSPSRSIEGSLYVLLLAIVGRFNTTLTRQTQFRDMFNLIKGAQITNVKQFVAGLPEDVRLGDVIDGTTKAAIETAKMFEAVNKILVQVSKNDTSNHRFYAKITAEIEAGQIKSFGQLCELLPNFIVDNNEEMRNARCSFRSARDSQTRTVIDFQIRAAAEIAEDVRYTKYGTVKNVTLRTLKTMVGDFAEPELMDCWWTLRDSARADKYTSTSNFLASMPEALYKKAHQLVVNILPQ